MTPSLDSPVGGFFSAGWKGNKNHAQKGFGPADLRRTVTIHVGRL
jgi:hypothetical protein